MNVERALSMADKWRCGMTHQQIADLFGVSRSCVSETIKRLNRGQALNTRGKKLDLSKIKYKYIYEHFKNNINETCTSLTYKVYGHAQANAILNMRNFLYGMHEVKFTVAQLQALCATIGRPFEELLNER